MTVLSRIKNVLLDERNRLPIALFFAILIYYASLIRVHYTFGDGPELLLAMIKLGGPHPSGYPLFTLLGFIPAHIGLPSPWWLVSFCLAAVPGALCVVGIYGVIKELGGSDPPAALGALIYGLNTHVVYQSTRVEVYALHCMLVVGALWAILRYLKTNDVRFAYASTFAVCLAMTNHLTSAFLVIPVTIAMLLGNRRQILKPKTIGTLLAISFGCALIYVYLPLQAMANSGDRISWNDPQTFERFWFHVSGTEYQIFRKWDKVGPTLWKFLDALEHSFFPGMLVVCALGLIDILIKRWKFVVVIVGFQIPLLVYVGSFSIRDISTYYTGLFIAVAIAFGVGVDWLVKKRFSPEDGIIHQGVRWVALTVCLAWVFNLAWIGRSNGYKEAVAQEMSESVMADIKEPAVILTSVDGHSFPIWYQTYVHHEGKKIAPIDTVMFKLKNKGWYREFFREHYDWLNWPDEKVATGSQWRRWLIENNPDVNFYVMLAHPWRTPGTYSVNHGWHNRVVRGTAPSPFDKSQFVKHIYPSRQTKIGKRRFFHSTVGPYQSGKEDLACITEWTSHNGITATWRFIGPDGNEIKHKPHKVPKGSNQSWEYLKANEQKPGEWTCEVTTGKEKPIITKFTLE